MLKKLNLPHGFADNTVAPLGKCTPCDKEQERPLNTKKMSSLPLKLSLPLSISLNNDWIRSLGHSAEEKLDADVGK